jgi:NAD(P)-dependent dehydrogenase (short-subunit alcohol dehydrogenase family)
MRKIVAITGAGAGVGRATVSEFARAGCDVALLSRDTGRLEEAAREARGYGVRALAIPTDVANAEAVEAAADQIENELGPIDVWVNVAMATVFAPVAQLTAAEVERATAVTYLGQVYGMMAALRRMTPRDRGAIVNVGSALAYRSVPLQSVYCGAKSAIRGFTDSLRSELLHDKLAITLSMVHLPAVNTPQFNWALNKTGRRAQPVPPIFQPEVAARAILFVAFHPRRQTWIGFPTVKAILANRIAPGLLDRYLATSGYTGQLTKEPLPASAPNNLFQPVPGTCGAHGRFDAKARSRSWEAIVSRNRTVVMAAIGLAAVFGFQRLSRHLDVRWRRT